MRKINASYRKYSYQLYKYVLMSTSDLILKEVKATGLITVS